MLLSEGLVKSVAVVAGFRNEQTKPGGERRLGMMIFEGRDHSQIQQRTTLEPA